jgi:UDP-N-acetylmuramate: L-alanyl-gamma-D-glutamyl-meso-diaminopimelate ligase
MHLYIMGICGTFMGGVARIAKSLGFEVTGSDQNVYPPMSTQLENLGIQINSGYSEANLKIKPDLVIVGNAICRNNPELEYVLRNKIPMVSGPQWLHDNVLFNKKVIAVAGTHGKTTTSSMLAWILKDNKIDCGFLIGGVPENFDVSASVGSSEWFVIEADEYDSAFFDKRAKFVHYYPKICILNNLEFDHADIYSDLSAIERQFHHLLRIIPDNGLILSNQSSEALQRVLKMGVWSECETFSESKNSDWNIELLSEDATEFNILNKNKQVACLKWSLLGQHNALNALAAISAAFKVGVSPIKAVRSLANFKSVKRRLEDLGSINGVRVFEDFAHHPTAINATLNALRAHVGTDKILSIVDFASNSMSQGVHMDQLARSFDSADMVWAYQTKNLKWDLKEGLKLPNNKLVVFNNIDEILKKFITLYSESVTAVIMSNRSFDGLKLKLLNLVQDKEKTA